MTRKHKNVDWSLPTNERGALTDWQKVEIAVLMDIRDQLQELNATLGCYRLQRMSDDIHRIDRRLQKHMPLPGGRR